MVTTGGNTCSGVRVVKTAATWEHSLLSQTDENDVYVDRFVKDVIYEGCENDKTQSMVFRCWRSLGVGGICSVFFQRVRYVADKSRRRFT